MCQENNNKKRRKGKDLECSERQSIERWWNRDKRTKVEIAELLDRNEKTIRNEIKRGLVKNLRVLPEKQVRKKIEDQRKERKNEKLAKA